MCRALAGSDCRPPLLRRRAGRPQLKRDPLGSCESGVNAASIAQYDGQIVELGFGDGARVRAHIISVDADVLENHIFYDVLDVLDAWAKPETWKRTLLASSAQDITDLRPTDGKRYAIAPGSKSFARPWWKFW